MAYPQWRAVLEERHIIASVRNRAALEAAANSPTGVVCLLFGNPLNIGDMIEFMRDSGKLPQVNLDLQTGASLDAVNAEFLSFRGVEGIARDALRAVSKHGRITVQRTLALDSAAVEAGLRASNQFLPGTVEILPAPAARRAARRFGKIIPCRELSPPG